MSKIQLSAPGSPVAGRSEAASPAVPPAGTSRPPPSIGGGLVGRHTAQRVVERELNVAARSGDGPAVSRLLPRVDLRSMAARGVSPIHAALGSGQVGMAELIARHAAAAARPPPPPYELNPPAPAFPPPAFDSIVAPDQAHVGDAWLGQADGFVHRPDTFPVEKKPGN